jgi:hypothetical protein
VVHVTTLVLLVWTSWVVVSLVLLWTSVHVSLTLVEVGVHGFVMMHNLDQLLQNLGQEWVTGKVIQVESTSLLSLILLEVGLINGFFLLDLSDLLDLIMVDHESLTVIGLTMKGLLGSSSRVWGLEADEGKSITSFTLLESDLLDLSKLFEQVLDISLGPLTWEVLDVKVASLL